MSNEKHYPLHPNQSHPPIMTCEIPLEEYESLKREIAELQKQVHDYAQGLYVIQAKAEKEARRHKYKRCLAMAAYCNAKIEEYQANYDADEGFGDEWLYWIKFMRKWMRRWLEFADKLKECF